MPDEKKDTRPWYRKKTNWGLGMYLIGTGLEKIPGNDPWINFAGWALSTVGGVLAGYGIAKRIDKK